MRDNKRIDRKGGKFTFKWLGPYEVTNLTDHGLASLKNQNGTVLKKKFNKLLLKPYIESNTDYINDDHVSITEEENDADGDNNLFKPMDFGKPSLNDEPTESTNLRDKLPDEIVETILLNAISSCKNPIQEYHSIIRTCSRFQIVKQKGIQLLPRVYIQTHEEFEHSYRQNLIKVSVRKLTKVFGQNSGLILDISNLISEKKWRSA